MVVAAGEPATIEQQVRSWLADMVVGLNLCPFARPLLDANELRVTVCAETGAQGLRLAFLEELDLLQRNSEQDLATTVLIFSAALFDFEDYLGFLEEAQVLLQEAGLEGVVQLASFHPHYLFAGEAVDAASHYSNRSPYPVIHLLREAMLTRVLADGIDAEQIPQRNIATLEAIGVVELERRWRDLFGEPVRS